MSTAHRRVMDLALGLPALAAAAPVVGALALAVKLTSPGPAFYRQTRVGRGRRRIQVLKLRTMVVDADRVGAHVTAAGDPRITPLGRWLRRSKLDELPQLWNVVRGDMSLVGPRPEAERYVAQYRPEWERVFSVRPGITDPASLILRDEESLLGAVVDRERAYVDTILPAKLELALAGIDQASVLADLRLLVQTAVAVLGRTGDAHPMLVRLRTELRGRDG